MLPKEFKKPDQSDRRPLEIYGSFFKGNLHSHTTLTDGKLEPDELTKRYREAGYSFLAITDHYLYVRGAEFERNGFLMFPGIEVNFDDKEHYLFDHIIGVNLHPEDPKAGYPDRYDFSPDQAICGTGVQSAINELKRTGHYCVYAHPHWSRRSASDIAYYTGLDGIELFNSCCERSFACGKSDQHYDDLLMRGKRLNALAVDDTHSENALFGGWIMVKANELTHEAIADAIEGGRFYASTGPEIYDYGIENGTAFVECSNASEILFVTYGHWGRYISGENLTRGEYKLRGDEQLLRIEVRDARGRSAYTQPMYFI